MKLFKHTGKLFLLAFACIYAFCIFSGTKLLNCEYTENGASISLLGIQLPVEAIHADTALRVYSEIEQTASRMVPDGMKEALKQVSETLQCFSFDGE